MNILFLAHRIPYPPDKGEKIRACHILKHLAKNHRVHLGCFVDDPADWAHTDLLRQLCGGECLFEPLPKRAAFLRMSQALLSGQPLTTGYFASKAMARWVGTILRRYTMARVVVFSSAMAPFLLEQPGADPDHVLLDMVDVDSDKWRQYAKSASWPKRWVYAREARKLRALERAAVARFGATTLVSPFEAETLAALVPMYRSRIYALPNGIDLKTHHPDLAFDCPYGCDTLPLVMTGTMDYRPNVEGALWFAEEILPLIRKTLPQAHFYIAGARPAPVLCKPREAVTVTGKVADMRPYVAHARVVVAPLRLARGVQNKVLEGMAMARPVVATRPASRGLDIIPGHDLWVEDEPLAFAQAVIEAATGTDRLRIAANGRHRVERDYAWDHTLLGLDALLNLPPASLSRAG